MNFDYFNDKYEAVMKKLNVIYFILFFIFSSLSLSQNLINYDGILKIDDKKIPNGTYNLEISLLDPNKNNMLIWSEVHKDVRISTKKFKINLGKDNFSLTNIFKSYEVLILELRIRELGIKNRITLSRAAMQKAINKKK